MAKWRCSSLQCSESRFDRLTPAVRPRYQLSGMVGGFHSRSETWKRGGKNILPANGNRTTLLRSCSPWPREYYLLYLKKGQEVRRTAWGTQGPVEHPEFSVIGHVHTVWFHVGTKECFHLFCQPACNIIAFYCGRGRRVSVKSAQNGLNGPEAAQSIYPVAYRGGGWGVQTPSEIPMALQNGAKLNPIMKTVKNCWI